MRKELFMTIAIFTIVLSLSAQEKGTFTDSRDNKVYKIVKIGTQIWMAENLNVSTFRNGDPIMEAKTAEDWQTAGDEKKAAWCYYENDPENGKKYGKLYNFYAVTDTRGLAPKGMHIPTDKEITILTTYVGGEKTAGVKLKEAGTFNWKNPNADATNETGFFALPGGKNTYNGTFDGVGDYGSWWAASDYGTTCSWGMGSNYNFVGRYYNFSEQNGFSVRCLRD